MIALITDKTVYYFNKKFGFLKKYLLKDITNIVLIQTNANILKLNITGQKLHIFIWGNSHLMKYFV